MNLPAINLLELNIYQEPAKALECFKKFAECPRIEIFCQEQSHTIYDFTTANLFLRCFRSARSRFVIPNLDLFYTLIVVSGLAKFTHFDPDFMMSLGHTRELKILAVLLLFLIKPCAHEMMGWNENSSWSWFLAYGN